MLLRACAHTRGDVSMCVCGHCFCNLFVCVCFLRQEMGANKWFQCHNHATICMWDMSIFQGYVLVEDFFTPEELEPARAASERLVDIVAQRLFKAGKISSESAILSVCISFFNFLCTYTEVRNAARTEVAQAAYWWRLAARLDLKTYGEGGRRTGAGGWEGGGMRGREGMWGRG